MADESGSRVPVDIILAGGDGGEEVEIITHSGGHHSHIWRNSHPERRRARSTYEALLKVYQAASERFRIHHTCLHAVHAFHSAFARGVHESHVLHRAKSH